MWRRERPEAVRPQPGILRFYDFLNTSKDSNFLVVGASQQQAFRLVMDGDGNGLTHLFGRQAHLKHDDHGDHLEALTCAGLKKSTTRAGPRQTATRLYVVSLWAGYIFARSTSCT